MSGGDLLDSDEDLITVIMSRSGPPRMPSSFQGLVLATCINEIVFMPEPSEKWFMRADLSPSTKIFGVNSDARAFNWNLVPSRRCVPRISIR